jgi:hypothetical protein
VGIENIGVQIENPVRVLPMHRFCVGNKTAALSMGQHDWKVQEVLEAALGAAEAAGWEQAAAQQQQQPQQHSQGWQGTASKDACFVPPAPGARGASLAVPPMTR